MRYSLRLATNTLFASAVVVFSLLIVPTQAFPATGQFIVTVNLVEGTNAAFCRTKPALAFGAVVTVVCATGELVDINAPPRDTRFAPVHGGAYRFVLPGSYAGGLPRFYDGYTGYGTAASWRVIQLADRDYYELLVGW